ncbi:hypothetical protein GGX14DRAFT_408387 [Mycena pura]|uniref:Uncharacterized protein n=1 Tax=Mycena pura TaxID=153505 RepID=A0AAD6XXU6_9AGAR|nr:hypothetical protein GGX14DRAFT_408387 [Mycena pura]
MTLPQIQGLMGSTRSGPPSNAALAPAPEAPLPAGRLLVLGILILGANNTFVVLASWARWQGTKELWELENTPLLPNCTVVCRGGPLAGPGVASLVMPTLLIVPGNLFQFWLPIPPGAFTFLWGFQISWPLEYDITPTVPVAGPQFYYRNCNNMNGPVMACYQISRLDAQWQWSLRSL